MKRWLVWLRGLGSWRGSWDERKANKGGFSIKDKMGLPKRTFVIVAVSFFFIGAALLLNSVQGVTGFAVFEGSDLVGGFYIALWFVIAGLVVLAMAERDDEDDPEGDLELKIVTSRKFDKDVKGHPPGPINRAIEKIGTGKGKPKHLKGGDEYEIRTSKGGRVIYELEGDTVTLKKYTPDHKY
jgi:hypothetical protein